MKKVFSLVLITMLLAVSTAFAGVDRIDAARQGVVITEIVGGSPSASVIQEVGWMPMRQYNAIGELIWAGVAFNALANEGEYSVLDTYCRGNTAPSQFYLRLYNTTPTLTSTLSGISANEPATANGYAPASQGITRDSTGFPLVPQMVSSHYEITSKTITITASGGSIGPVTYAVLATSSDTTGKLVSYAALSQSRTLASGDSLQVTYKIRLQ